MQLGFATKRILVKFIIVVRHKLSYNFIRNYENQEKCVVSYVLL